jgi:Rhodopirellula transposase DDE domain
LPLAFRLPSCCQLDIQPPTRSSPHSLLLVSALEYSLRANAKPLESTGHPDRDQQFQHLNERVSRHLKAREPVISVDTKKKVVIGPYQNTGREWRSKGVPEKVAGA